MINETTLAELLFPHVTDSVTWCRLAHVSKRFNKVAKEKLIKIEAGTESYHRLPSNGELHGLYLGLHGNGNPYCRKYYRNGILQGPNQMWYENGQLDFDLYYQDGKLHGHCRSWFYHGAIHFDDIFNNGQKVEKIND